MRRSRGLALAIALILLAVLSLLGLAGARLGALELRLALGDELRMAAFEQALSQLDASAGEASATRLQPMPPPPGSGYSADRFVAEHLQFEAGDEIRLRQGIAVLHAADLALPRTGVVALGRNEDGAPRGVRAEFRLGDHSPWLTIVRADNGETLWQAGEPRAPIAAAPALLDSDADGLVDRLYLADIGGGIWRADLSAEVSQWRLTLLASLRGPVLFAPDVVQLRDDRGPYALVIVASEGVVAAIADREDGAMEAWRRDLPEGEKTRSSPFVASRRIWLATNRGPRCLRLDSGAAAQEPLILAEGGQAPAWTERNDSAGCSASLRAGNLVLDSRPCPRFRTFWQHL